MFEEFMSGLGWILGLDAGDPTVWQMAARAVVAYPVGIAFVRIGEKRFIGKFTAFDVIMGIVIGSILARAITGGSPFFPSLMAGLVLVSLHYLFATLSYHLEWFGDLVKGSGRTLVKDGRIQWEAMRKSHISERDLKGALRENGGVDDIERVRLARLERSGNISVVSA
ncbi:MAG: DUF421 domain-containing protein [Gammaproteobacteria bacterium]|jgi:uncharacterized membrane protein YcaP (DUF421 family)|nr:DUF421 domain-containing protein [Gammaproteobacteria bacterium]